MTIEIELKFLVKPDAITALLERIARYPTKHHATLALSNCYYDTAQGDLRAHQLGLRIRGCDDHYEMTLKSAGNAIGGIAHRAEYTVALADKALAVSLLPAQAWPDNLDPLQLQTALRPQFSTDYQRQLWLIDFEQSQIEIAFDRGEIYADDRTEPICELELELKQGNAADLLALAQQLTQQDGLRLSQHSKASRGYALLNGTSSPPDIRMTVLTVPQKATVEQGLIAALEWALRYWQNAEDAWVKGDQRAKSRVRHALFVLRQCWQLFSGLISRKSTASLRESLSLLEQQLESADCADDVCTQSAYLQFKLAVMAWHIHQRWRSFANEKNQRALAGSFKRFADIMLSRTRAELKAMVINASIAAESEGKTRLEKLIINLYLLAGAYPQQHTLAYINGWQRLVNGSGDWAQLHRDAVAQTPFWLNSAQRDN